MFDDKKKKELLQAGQAVYSSYLLLDFCSNPYYATQSKAFKINGHSFKEYIQSKLKNTSPHDKLIEDDFTLNGKKYHLKLTRETTEGWKVEVEGDTGIKDVSIKPLNKYNPEEFITLLQKSPVMVSQEKSTKEYKFSTCVEVNGKKVTVGGLDQNGNGKVELYQLHLNNLQKMLANLSGKNPNLNMLIAMATGSGKSYTQALWFLITYLSDCSCAFAVPQDNLVTQLKADFGRLLPQEVVAAIKENDLSQEEGKPFFTITTYKKLLGDFWSDLNKKISANGKGNLFLCFDEEHDPMRIELFKERIKLLAKKIPALFLSATPSKTAYAICGNKPVASLSKKQKEELKIVKPAISVSAKAKRPSLKGKNLVEKLVLKFVGAIEELRISSAHTYVNETEIAVHFRKKTDPFYFEKKTGSEKPNDKDIKRMLRWNTHCPVGDKALILTKKHDPVVNIGGALNGENYAYKNGNLIDRRAVYNLFGFENLDAQNFTGYSESKKSFRRQAFVNYLKEQYPDMESESINRIVDAHIDLGETSDYVKFRVLHGIIENTLEFLTGLSSVSLDQKRFQDLPGLMRMIEEKLGRLPVDDQALKLNLKKYLENMKLPESITDRIASAMLEVIKKLKAQGNEEIKECIVDNWQLDRKIHGAFSFSPNCCHLMDQFKTVYLMSGLSGTATPIQDNKPFYNLSMETPVLADYAPAKEAPMKHKLSTIEALDAETTQKVYSPKYCPDDLTPSMVDTLFKRGFIGTYITSERTTGFNDPNLNHVAVLLDQDDDMNNPDQIIQAVGRNRGLNPAQQPYFMLVEDEGVSMAFSPDLLEKENYFGDLFKARENKHKKVTRSLGKKIAAEIQSWLETATDPYGAVDPIQLQEKTREILLREFNKIYEENHHNFKKAKAEFCGVLEDVHQALHMSAKALDRSYELPFAARVISNIVNTVSRVWYNHVTSSSKKAFNEECKKIAKTEDVKRERTYIHIIQKYNFKEIIVTSLAAKRLKDVIKETTEKTMSYIVNHLNPSLLEKEACEKINRFVKEGLAVKALKYLGTLEQQVKLFDLLQEKDWVELILQYANGLEIKNEADYISVFFEVIKKDKKINSYIEENKIELNLKSPEKAAASFTEKKDKLLQSLQNILTGESEKKEEDSTLLFNNFVKENLETIVFSLHPKHAAIFLKYKNNFNFNHTIFNEIDSQKVLDNAEIVSLLINGLEAGILTDQEKNDLAIDESDTFFKEGENIVKNIKHNLNSGEIRNSLSRSLERFIKSSEYSTLFSKILDPLSDDQLLIILDAIYPNDNDNARKRDLMIAFKKDVETLPAQALFDKYCTFTGTDLENTDLNKIQNWTSDVLGEITDSLCHYHGMSSRKGDAFGAIIQPKLKKVPNQNHPIWRLHATDDSSFLTGLAKKTQFIKGIIDAFDSWNSIDKIKNKHLKKAMQGAAASVIHHVTAAAQNKKLEASSDFGLSKMFGEQIFRGSSLTAQEIASPETKITGGVEKITSNSQEGVLEKGSVAPHMPENIQKQEPLMTHSVVHKTTVIGKVASVCAILTVAMAVASLVCHATIFAIPVGVICSIASAGFLIVGVVAKAIEKKQNSEKSICSNATTFRNGLYTNLISQQDNSLVV